MCGGYRDPCDATCDGAGCGTCCECVDDQVCGGHGDPCDATCGGAGCGTCGAGLSCNGAVTKSKSALKFARNAEETLKNKEKEAASILDDVSFSINISLRISFLHITKNVINYHKDQLSLCLTFLNY